MLVPSLATSQLAEEYRVIKRPLLMNAFPDEDNGIARSNLILVTSSVPGEGKTFTAMNLALSIAMERDKKVILVDADVAKPSIARILGIDREKVERVTEKPRLPPEPPIQEPARTGLRALFGGMFGPDGQQAEETQDRQKPDFQRQKIVRKGLIDLLREPNLTLEDVVLEVDEPGLRLSLMTAGKQDRHSTELLASDAMKRLVNEWSASSKDRIVIFDSPPLLAATQGAVLAGLVGQVVLVVEADRTPQYVVQESLSKLESCEVVGLVLNKTNKGLGFNYYGYFYGYGYGYGHYGQQQKLQETLESQNVEETPGQQK
jgi:Mrp family chromosome partitioning ATPase